VSFFWLSCVVITLAFCKVSIIKSRKG
jgi:hypothetical protein